MIDPNVVVRKLANGQVHVETLNREPSMTDPQFKDECDINNIMKKYISTGEFTHVTGKQGVYGDFSKIQDYQGMLDTVRYAQEAFATLPASVRSRFRNDPGELLAFLQDSRNLEEAVSLGLCERKSVSDSGFASKRDDSNDADIGSTSVPKTNGATKVPKKSSTPATLE